MKSAKILASFTTYCEAHPNERFWQALRNWSGFGFVYVSNDPMLPRHPYALASAHKTFVVESPILDTFSWEGRRATRSER